MRRLYKEGLDFEKVRDDSMVRIGLTGVPIPGEYDNYHVPPPMRLTKNSKIKHGQKLRVSFYHALTIYGRQVTCCLSEPKVYDILRDEVQGVQKMLQPQAFFMSHDEIRMANWCAACQKRNLTPGQLLADHVQRCVSIIRDVNPQAKIYVWSGMFDPYRNAHEDYYLVNGNLKDSWEGLPPEVTIVNLNFSVSKRKNSISCFANRGHKQILAGYWNKDKSNFYTPQWLAEARDIPCIIGVMYTTWRSRYDDLECWADSVWDSENYYIWFNPLNFQAPYGSSLRIEKGGIDHSILIQDIAQGGMKQWINLGLTLPSHVEIKQIIVHYKMLGQGYIDRISLTETTDPGRTIIKHVDDTDLTSTKATVYHSDVCNLQPNGSITLRLDLFLGVAEIKIGGIGVLVEEVR